MDIITGIILNDKYASFWEGDIRQYMLNNIVSHIWYKSAMALMDKYKIRPDVIADSLLSAFIIYKDYIRILAKYQVDEQICIIKSIMHFGYNLRALNIDLLFYILHTCDYSICEWKAYRSKILNKCERHENVIIIKRHIVTLILYDGSLRNTWITAVII